jgi:hypothetical protein
MRRLLGKGTSGPGLYLLTALVAAFLLVPAAAASALPANVVISGSGGGTVDGIGLVPGEPPLECHKSAGESAKTCTTEANEVEGGAHALEVEQVADEGSKFVEWKVLKGSVFEGCLSSSAKCLAVLIVGTEIKIEAVFEKEPEYHIEIEGNGSGRVIGSEEIEIPGEPPVNCVWNGETQEYEEFWEGWEGELSPVPTVCDTEPQSLLGLFNGVGVEAEAAPGSEFVGWVWEEGVDGGFQFEGSCSPSAAIPGTCSVLQVAEGEEEVTIKAVFEPTPSHPLTVTKTGGGSGTVTSSPPGINCGSECEASFEAETLVTLSASAATGSEFTGWTGSGCSGTGTCEVTMSEAKSVEANFEIETFALTLNPSGEGTLSAECNGGACASLTEIPYNTNVVVTATPNSIEYVLASLTGSGSAAGKCNLGAGTCTFAIKASSEVAAEFASGAIRDSHPAYVHGEVPQTTTLESACGDVNLGEFIPNLQEDATYAKTCGLIVTSTGGESDLSAADETGEAVGRLGHLVQPSYSLAEPLETMATDNDGLGGTSGTGGVLAPLTSPLTLLSYAVPVNYDHVTLEFSQLIKQHDPLHTGEYSKTITLTLEQTAL